MFLGTFALKSPEMFGILSAYAYLCTRFARVAYQGVLIPFGIC